MIFDKKKMSTLKIDTKFIYRELLKKVIEMFATGKAPLDIHETLEIVAFIEGAWKSAMNHGSGEKVAKLKSATLALPLRT